MGKDTLIFFTYFWRITWMKNVISICLFFFFANFSLALLINVFLVYLDSTVIFKNSLFFIEKYYKCKYNSVNEILS